VRVIVDENNRPTDAHEGLWAFGWSHESLEEARKHGQARAKQIAAKLHNNTFLAHDYPYPDRPLREELILEDDAGSWAITRNGYGSLVLNSNEVMFVDIDLNAIPRWGAVGRFLNLYKPERVEPVVERTLHVMQSIPGLAGRVYRTAAGLRLLITSQTQDPASGLTQDMLTAFGSDKRYALLCKAQKSFRARLTPKYWRCGFTRPPLGYPFASAEDRQAFERWSQAYSDHVKAFDVCELLSDLPSTNTPPAIERIVALHDQYTLSSPGKPLA
jgi:hypothetical protein